MYAGFWSLMPFLIVIPVSILTRQVIPGLAAGLFLGAAMIARSILGSLDRVIHYLLLELAVPDNLRLIVFLYAFGALVGLVRVAGGISGFGQWVRRFIHSAVAGYNLIWLSSLGTFMAPDFRIITLGPVMETVMRDLRVRKEEIGYAIDVTSTPLIVLIPAGTAFVGYMVGLLATALRHQHLPQNPYHLYLLSIPFNFFALVMLVLGIAITMLRAFRADRGKQGIAPAGAGGKNSKPDSSEHKAAEKKFTPDPLEYLAREARPDALHLILPMGLLLLLTFFFTWWSGYRSGGGLLRANASHAMLQAIFLTILFAAVLYTLRGQKIGRVMTGIIKGGNEMVEVIVLLVLVWALSAVSTELGFDKYIGLVAGRNIPAVLIAPSVFVTGSILSYFIGSSFGTWGILLPLSFSLANSTHASLVLTAAAVFASGTFGGFASPLSDNTVAMAAILHLPVIDYARYKLKTALISAFAATVLFGLAGYWAPV